LRLIVDWARQRQAGADVRKLTLAQIQDYQRLTES
jgi:CDP-glucose 4,6-dehydratase